MYTQHTDVDKYLKLNYITVKSLINMCFTSKKDYDWCHLGKSWVQAFKNEQCPLFEPYPTTIKDWIKRYNATIKAIDLLNMHNLYLSHFTKDKIEEDLEDLLVIDNLDCQYTTLYDLPLPKSLLSNLGLDNVNLNDANINLYTYKHGIEIVYDGDHNDFVEYEITDNDLVYILIKVTEETNLVIHEPNGLPFDLASLEKLYRIKKDPLIKERINYLNKSLIYLI